MMKTTKTSEIIDGGFGDNRTGFLANTSRSFTV
jgi:hypothetical protein